VPSNWVFTLNEIKELLMLESSHCQQAQQLASQQLESIQQRITDLTAMAQALRQLIDICHEGKRATACPIIDTLGKDQVLARAKTPAVAR
jgi:MerR family mercuric resistance operon transcriptional regulator